MIENQYIFMHMRTTKYYYYFSLLQLLLAFIIIIFFFLSKSGLILETFAAFLMTADILIRYFSQQNYLKSFLNVLDAVVASALWIFIAMDLISNSFSMTSDQLSFLVLVARYGLQFYRLGSLLKQSNNSGKIQDISQINLEINFEDSCMENILINEHNIKNIKNSNDNKKINEVLINGQVNIKDL